MKKNRFNYAGEDENLWRMDLDGKNKKQM